MVENSPSRRPLKSRDTLWAGAAARLLIRCGLRPNTVSVLSIFFAALAGVAFWLAPQQIPSLQPWFLFAAALNIQLRLLCNLFDGMIAIEGGFKTKSGEIYNELPDRFADIFILVGAGYTSLTISWLHHVGWLAAALAVMTAYVRALGASTGAGQQFCGPMAKPHRMAAVTIASLLDAFALWFGWSFTLLPWCLVIVSIGCLITIFRRTSRIVRTLESQ
ncbi:MAG TPA: CDP-alcohol phosphatidyltransferase family protein [Verrucomicrobiae bacterium]